MKDEIVVLLVDDDPMYFSIVKQLLAPFQGKRFKVFWESDGQKALEKLANTPGIDVVLMDYYLPEMDGLAITKLMAERALHKPIIFFTANKDFRAAVEAMKFGAEDYLLKEETKDTILPRTILNVIERSQLKARIQEAEKQKILFQKRTEAIKELVVTMCHEFNNPLAAIKISTSILTRQDDDEEKRRLLDKFNANVMILEKEINKLRDLNMDKF